MKNYFCLFIILFININIFAHEGIKTYMVQNNMNYPYNVSQNINKVYYVDYFSGESHGDVTDSKELTNEQKKTVNPFLKMLEKINIPEYFNDLKKQPGVVAFSINRVDLVRQLSGEEYFQVDVQFYCDRNIGGQYIYYKEFNFWRYFNIALYSINDYKFLGFHFE